MTKTENKMFVRFAQGCGIVATLVLGLFVATGTVYAQTPISEQLNPGDTGSGVSTLQTFLSSQNQNGVVVYPQGLVTGYYGFLTEAAVSNYQVRHGITGVGAVGPITLSSINSTINGTGGTVVNNVNNNVGPTISDINSAVGTNSATITWTANEPVYGLVMYSMSSPVIYASASSADSNWGLSNSQSVALTGLQQNTTYYFVIKSTDASGNVNYNTGTSFMTQ
jgi:peptidoglycan hydrolase-like protein with peptidoglycan-binding domain